tara:strand:+ start:101618 stop:102142 length:525 start_codon:yes stop_codon:yes gene_type:complete
MSGIAIVNLVAILLSPLIAVLVTQQIERTRRKMNFRRLVLQALLANRHSKTSHDAIQAMNVVEFAFHDCKSVRKLFREYMEMLGNQGLTATDEGWLQINEKYGELSASMASSAGLGSHLSYQDMLRYYVPKSLEMNATKADNLSHAMMSFFTSNAAGTGVINSDDAANKNITTN